MSRRWSSVLLLVALSALVLAPVAHATTLKRLDLNALVQRAEVVVRGEVKEVTTLLERGKVFTTVVVKVDKVLKGQPGEAVTLRLIGGRHGDLVTLVHGQPQFKQGEQVVLFLERSRPERPFMVVGMAQGKFTVTTDKDGKTRWAAANLGTAHLVDPQLMTPRDTSQSSLKPVEPSLIHQGPILLDQLEQQIRDAVRASEAAR
jgi:hypothetical protein